MTGATSNVISSDSELGGKERERGRERAGERGKLSLSLTLLHFTPSCSHSETEPEPETGDGTVLLSSVVTRYFNVKIVLFNLGQC